MPAAAWTRRHESASRRSVMSAHLSRAHRIPDTDRADPKGKIGLFNKLGTATISRRSAMESELFTRILGMSTRSPEDPQVIDAWFMRGTKYLAHGDLEKAVDDFKRTLTLKPDYDLAVFNLAQAYRRMGNDDAALAGFEHYLTLDRTDPFVHYQMGEIWLDRGDLPKPNSCSAARSRSIRASRPRKTPSVSSPCNGATPSRPSVSSAKPSPPSPRFGSLISTWRCWLNSAATSEPLSGSTSRN